MAEARRITVVPACEAIERVELHLTEAEAVALRSLLGLSNGLYVEQSGLNGVWEALAGGRFCEKPDLVECDFDFAFKIVRKNSD